MRKGGEVHETFLLWRKRGCVGGAVREVSCLVDHLGESLFELKLVTGHDLILSEPFQDTEKLLARAEELRTTTRVRPAS